MNFTYENTGEILKNISLLKTASPESLEVLLSYMRPLKLREGELLFDWKQKAKTLYLSISGDFLLSFPDNRSFSLHGSAHIIGMNAMLDGTFYTARALALSKSLLMALYHENRKKMLKDHPRFSERIQGSIRAYMDQRLKYKNSADIYIYGEGG